MKQIDKDFLLNYVMDNVLDHYDGANFYQVEFSELISAFEIAYHMGKEDMKDELNEKL
jgi:hypothetical protein